MYKHTNVQTIVLHEYDHFVPDGTIKVFTASEIFSVLICYCATLKWMSTRDVKTGQSTACIHVQ